MRLKPGDHVCALYRSERELVHIVSEFLAEGLGKSERCWYVPASDDPGRIRTALADRGIDVRRATKRGALSVLPSNAAYGAGGDFEPEETLAVFNGAIEQAMSDGFDGFRAAANMSWALDLDNGVERLITYEALLRSLFSSARATGLCLYDRRRMPLAVIDGALSTHPLIRANEAYCINAFYDVDVRSLAATEEASVMAKLARLGVSPAESARRQLPGATTARTKGRKCSRRRMWV